MTQDITPQDDQTAIQKMLKEAATNAIKTYPWLGVVVVSPLYFMAIYVFCLFLAAITSDIFQLFTPVAGKVYLGGAGWSTLTLITLPLAALIGLKVGQNKPKKEEENNNV